MTKKIRCDIMNKEAEFNDYFSCMDEDIMRKNKISVRKLMRNPAAVFIALLVIAVFFIYEQWFSGPNYAAIPDGHIAVHFVDVGQGDATIVQTPNGKNMLIDTGTPDSRNTLCQYIRSLGIKSFDYLVLTHPHDDHIGGALRILDEFEVNAVIMPDANHTSYTYEKLLNGIIEKNIPVKKAVSGDEYKLDAATFTVLAPNDTTYASLNNYSVVLRLVFGRNSFLFCGDAETLSENEMLKRFSPSELQSDILKLGHHGSSTSSSKKFLDAVCPAVAIVSAGENNDYGHPHPAVIKRLENAGVSIYRTYSDGTIVLWSDGNTVTRMS